MPAAGDRLRILRDVLYFVLRAGVSIGLIVWLIWTVGFSSLANRLTSAHLGYLALGVPLTFVQVVLGAWRWRRIVTALGGGLGFGRLFIVFYAGAFWNFFLPGSVGGDFIRGWLAYRGGMRLAVAVNSVLLDRVATVLSLILANAALTVPLYALFGEPALIFPALGVLAIGGISTIMILELLPASWLRWRIVRGLFQLSRDCRTVFLKLATLLEILGLGFAVLIAIVVLTYVQAIGLGIDVTLLQCMLLVPPAIMFTILPISIGGWGIREVGFVYAFGAIGIPSDAALSLSIVLGAIAIVTVLPGGLLWFRGKRLLPAASA